MHTDTGTALELRDRWREVKATQKLRARDAAEFLGVSEGELLASLVGEGATRLGGDLRALAKRLPELGPVMALTRNEACVHEKDGPYLDVSAESMVGLVLGEKIDLRLFFSHWVFAYALEEETPRGTQRSLQVFDSAGRAVHKVYLRPASNVEAWRKLVADLASDNQLPGERVLPAPGRAAARPDAEIDVEGLQMGWAGMKDTHEFFGLLKKFGVQRTQALRLAGQDFARRVPCEAARWVLECAARDKLSVMVFVGNAGCIQIHTGPVENVKLMDRWLNVLDEGFNLHLREDLVTEAWVVEKPAEDGVVTSVELFDAHGDTIAMFFGARKPGKPELPAWRDLVGRLFPA